MYFGSIVTGCHGVPKILPQFGIGLYRTDHNVERHYLLIFQLSLKVRVVTYVAIIVNASPQG